MNSKKLDLRPFLSSAYCYSKPDVYYYYRKILDMFKFSLFLKDNGVCWDGKLYIVNIYLMGKMLLMHEFFLTIWFRIKENGIKSTLWKKLILFFSYESDSVEI